MKTDAFDAAVEAVRARTCHLTVSDAALAEAVTLAHRFRTAVKGRRLVPRAVTLIEEALASPVEPVDVRLVVERRLSSPP